MRLTFLGIDTGKDGCPTLYSTDRESYVVQGWRVGDAAVIAELGLEADETCVEVPARLMTFLEDPGDLVGTGRRPYLRTAKGTYVVKGPEVTDAEALAQMDVPGHETAVEVPKQAMADLARNTTWSG
ncbi:hypothetical protein [Thermomonospora amylolytica]|uniref:hypothetical protein n=1 Tax=Thermomonospora amylolytica TaxID=1411117 RepID=UPI000E6CC5E0|nr:hypothetical protein [Thermomonospora amylolytica]